MKLRKILSLILIPSLLASALFSCARTPESLTEKADKALSNKAHVIEVGVDYTVDNEAISAIFDQLERREVKLLVDGDKTAIEDRMSISYSGGETEFVNSYVVIGGIIYMDMKYTSAEGSNSTRGKSEVGYEDAVSFKEKASVIGGISYEDFLSSEVTKRDGDREILSTGAGEELKVRLENIIISALSGAAEKVKVKDARLTVELDGKKYETVTLVCDYDITMSGYTYTVTAEYELEYDYDEHVDITAPANPSDYPDMELETILRTL
ncbi:MAG: hypothetical protein IJW53_02350 [Clostridia bacterium]|nr:hypothetical protein [Clostridia bacterium]